MANTYTTHLNLVKQDPNTVPDYQVGDSNLDIIDNAVWSLGETLNGRTENIPSFAVQTVTSPGTTLNISNSSRIVIDTLSTAAGRCGTLFVYVNASGGVTCFKNGAADITVDYSVTNKLTLSCNTSFTAYIRIYDGSVT